MSPSAPSIRNTVPTTLHHARPDPSSTAEPAGMPSPQLHPRADQHLAQPAVVGGIEVGLHHAVRQPAEAGDQVPLEDAAGELPGALGGGGDRHHHPALGDLPRQRLGGRRVLDRLQQVVRHPAAEVDRRHVADALRVAPPPAVPRRGRWG